MQTRDLYNFRSRRYWLHRFENYGRKEAVPVDSYTIEHIMPQNEKLSVEWQIALGENWKRIQKNYLHSLGNLTLTGYNSEYSDRPYADKRDMEGGFKYSPLKVNEGLGSVEIWNEASIKSRATKLAIQAVTVWGSPSLDAAILAAYQPESGSTTNYTIDDHPYLMSGSSRQLFDAFRKEVLALDPCVSEEFLKLYVAFKAETNFVDVVPLAKRLRLSLNMRYADINDPLALCRDVTNLGRWGNGDVEVMLSSLEDLPYIIGLVRQSLELQLGETPE
jgi:predicted transport protein